jgi:hypothetical protein
MDIQNIVRLSTRLLGKARHGLAWGRRRAALGTLGALALLSTSCGITEMNIPLAEQKFTYDLMNSFPFPIPKQVCPKPPSTMTCQSIFTSMTGIIDNRVKASCDTATDQCVVDLSLIIVYIINVAEDPAFTTGFAQGQADAVRDVTLNYTITNNGNFNIDKIDVYIGPNGIMSKSDAGVVPMESLGPIPANGLLTQNQQPMIIVDGTPAHAQVIENIKNPAIPFNFLMTSTVRFKGGDPLPTGSVVVQLQPVVKLLKR